MASDQVLRRLPAVVVGRHWSLFHGPATAQTAPARPSRRISCSTPVHPGAREPPPEAGWILAGLPAVWGRFDPRISTEEGWIGAT
jgi:hypothetical protein